MNLVSYFLLWAVFVDCTLALKDMAQISLLTMLAQVCPACSPSFLGVFSF